MKRLPPSDRRSDIDRSSTDSPATDPRRLMVLVISIVLLVACGVVTWKFGSDGSARFLSAATGRVGLLMAALWLAWPSLKKPARWLPPGIAVAGVIGLAVIAVRPQLALVVFPAIATVGAITVFVRGLR
ncbi:hypothetical protein [Rubripirellula tenax]|nr:hypothetical protein [Rubripirellula tenax]